MAVAAATTFSNFSSSHYSLSLPSPNHHKIYSFSLKLNPPPLSYTRTPITAIFRPTHPSFRPSAAGGSGGAGDGGGGGGGGGGDYGDGNGGDERERIKVEALRALEEAGRSAESLPEDMAAAVAAGRLPAEIVRRYLELEKSAVFRWLLGFGGFRERLLADDIFLTKVAIECGVGIFTKVLFFK